jgi:hypothetical protein
VWSQAKVDISTYADSKIQIGFQFTNGGSGVGAGWYIDDVEIRFTTPIVVAQGTPFIEDFETGLGDWGVWNGSWEIGMPTSGPAECFGGSNQCAGTVLDGTSPNNSYMLFSPAIVLPAIGATDEIHLFFQEWFSFASGDEGRVYVRTQTSPGVWSGWGSPINTRVLNSGGIWSPTDLPQLTSYAGSIIQIGFQFTNGGSGVGAGWFIDDVSVSIIAP